jgi:hypothetical protein
MGLGRTGGTIIFNVTSNVPVVNPFAAHLIENCHDIALAVQLNKPELSMLM